MDRELNVIIECLYASISEIDDFLIISGEEGDALFDYSGSEIIPFGNWSFYNADQNHLVVVNAETGVIYKYIEKRTSCPKQTMKKISEHTIIGIAACAAVYLSVFIYLQVSYFGGFGKKTQFNTYSKIENDEIRLTADNIDAGIYGR